MIFSLERSARNYTYIERIGSGVPRLSVNGIGTSLLEDEYEPFGRVALP